MKFTISGISNHQIIVQFLFCVCACVLGGGGGHVIYKCGCRPHNMTCCITSCTPLASTVIKLIPPVLFLSNILYSKMCCDVRYETLFWQKLHIN
jgi:hypothetical protein